MDLELDTRSGNAGLAGLGPVGRATVQDRIHRQLRDRLIRGEFDAGEVFLPGDIARRMSVSSMPVREALARLVSERALEVMPNRRVRVPPLALDRARDIVQARMLIEGDLAARAAAAISPGEIDALEALTRQYEAAPDARSVAVLNHAFHFGLYARAGSAVLLSFVESLWMQAGPYVRAAASRHRPLQDAAATRHHRGILAAIGRGDSAAVTRELRADVAQVFAILERAGPELWGEGGEAAR